MTPRLVPATRAAWIVVAVCLAVVAVPAVFVHDDTRGNGVDDAVQRWIGHLPDWCVSAALHLTDPPLVVTAIAGIALVAAVRRRWDVVALAVLAPALALATAELVLKPIVHRSNAFVTGHLGMTHTLAYPSGHETGLAALVWLVVVVVLSAPVRPAVRAATVGAAVVVLVVGAVGLVGDYYHYASDTLAAIALSLAVTLATARAVDGVHALIVRRRTPDRVPS